MRFSERFHPLRNRPRNRCDAGGELAVQILHAGDLVRARGDTWRVVDVRPYEGCRLVSLAGIGATSGASCEVLSPFDRLDAVAGPSTALRRVGSGRWRNAARALIGTSGVAGLLQAAGAADMDILPHQLEPAVALLRGDGCRVLLADEVGLGKTIQACVIAAELGARGMADRVLVLTPPGLRDQWQQELADRFHLDATIADFRAVRRRAADLPADVSPWATWPIAIASIDYVKRPEVLRAVLDCRWDVVILDEAHRVANDGDRRQAASALSARAGYVVLLTATPHSGDGVAFQSLCGLGSVGDRLLVFRRTRSALSFSPAGVRRRVHRLHVRSTFDERLMHAKLDAFARAVRAERGDADRDMWIALALLEKRAFSSAEALRLSVTRRLESLAGAAQPAQLLLPLDDYGESTDADAAPAWHAVLGLQDIAHERRLLAALADAAATAARSESKIAAVRRLLRRIDEPVIIFTEYRDTLAHLARQIAEPSALVHGGLSRIERASALQAFANRRARILLATDAAAEGLNLHHTCRLVVNLELPWNPMRLEQRIGRVDRIGQTRTVHACHLIGGDSGELRLLEQLRERIARAQCDIGVPDPLDGALDPPDAADQISSDQVDVHNEQRRLQLRRALHSTVSHDGRPLITDARNRRTRARLGRHSLSLWECTVEDARHCVVSSSLIATLHEPVDEPAAVAGVASVWSAAAITTARRFAATARVRAQAIGASLESRGLPSMQPGLFDRRAHFALAALEAAQTRAAGIQNERDADLKLREDVAACPPRLRLVMVPRP